MRILQLSRVSMPPEGRPDLAQRLAELPRPDVLVLTGGLTRTGRPPELKALIGLLTELGARWGLPLRRIVLVPGRADVPASLIQTALLEAEDHGETPPAAVPPKWKYLTQEVGLRSDGLGLGGFNPSEPWSHQDLGELRLVVAGFNSAWAWLPPGAVPAPPWESEAAARELAAGWETQRRTLGAALCAGLGLRLVVVEEEAPPEFPALLEGVGADLVLAAVPAPGRAPWSEAPEVLLWELGDGVARAAAPGQPDAAWSVAMPRVRGQDRFEGAWSSPSEGGRKRLVDRVVEVLRLREEGAEVEAAGDELVVVRRGSYRVPFGVMPVVGAEAVRRHAERMHPWHWEDPSLASVLIHGSPPDEPTQGEARRLGVRLKSLAELQSLCDFDALLAWQARAVAADPRYPHAAYLPQHGRLGVDGSGGPVPDVRAWAFDFLTADDDDPRLLLALAPFGTGKSFLVRELIRQLSERWVPGMRVPLWIELRHLEKAGSFRELLAAHLTRAGQTKVNHAQLDYLRREGRLVLLFDGLDELVLRASYERATEHLATLAQAASGGARVLVTARTEHFVHTRDAQAALLPENAVASSRLRKLDAVPGIQVLHISPFRLEQRREFLRRRLGEGGERRYRQLAEVPDLLGLAETPRMLELLAELSEADLDAARRRAGPVHAAALYEQVLTTWIQGEASRRTGGPALLTTLGARARRDALRRLALRAWGRATEDLGRDDLVEVAQLIDRGELDVPQVEQELGSGTFLVRDEAARWRFAHRSVLEYLVAKECADALLLGEPPAPLDRAEVSPVLVGFLGDLSRAAFAEWLPHNTRRSVPELRRRNALAIAAAWGVRVPVDLAGEDLRGRDDLRRLDLRGADLRGADLRGLDLSGVDLSGADLDGARIRDVRFARALLHGVRGTPVDTWGSSFLGAEGLPESWCAWVVEEEGRVEVELSGHVTDVREADGWLAVAVAGVAVVIGADGGHRRAIDVAGLCRSVGWPPGAQRLLVQGLSGVLHTYRAPSATPVGVFDVGAVPAAPMVLSQRGGALGISCSGDRSVVLRLDEGCVPRPESAVWVPGRLLALDEDGGRALLIGPGGVVQVRGLRESGVLHEINLEGFQPLDGWFLAGEEAPELVLSSASGTHLRRGGCEGAEVKSILDDSVMCTALSPDEASFALGTYPQGVVVARRGEPARVVHPTPVPVSGPLRWLSEGAEIAAPLLDGGLTVFHADGPERFDVVSGETKGLRAIRWMPSASGWVSVDGEGEVSVSVADGSKQHRWGTFPGARDVVGAPGTGGVRALSSQAIFEGEAPSSARTRALDAPVIGFWTGKFSPDGSSVLVCDAATGPRVLDNYGGTAALSGAPEGVLLSGAWADDGAHVGVVGWEGRAALWAVEAPDHPRRVPLPMRAIWTLALSPDGSRVAFAGTDDGAVLLADLPDPTLRPTAERHRGAVHALAFSPDGRTLASAGVDGTIRLWDPADGRAVSVIEGIPGALTCLAWSPDGLTLASGGSDGKLRFWEAATGRAIGWTAQGPRGAVAVAADGRFRTFGDVEGWLWIAHGLHRYEAHEIDHHFPGRRITEGPVFRLPAPAVRTSTPPPRAPPAR